MLINAGAWAGKTHTITERMIYLIEKKWVLPFQIMAMTFTNKAAREMKERIEKKLKNNENIKYRTPPMVWTFHSIALKFLKKYYERFGYRERFTILDASDSTKILKDVFKDGVNWTMFAEGVKKVDFLDFEEFINRSKQSGFSWTFLQKYLRKKKDEESDKSKFEKEELFISLYREYQNRLTNTNCMDFDDILIYFRDILKLDDIYNTITDEYKYFFVDEFQDTNPIQYEIIKLLSSKDHNLCVIGDDYQSIYAFRWAKIKNILSFSERMPKDVATYTLEENYRSTSNIVAAASELISKNQGQLKKKLFSSLWEGEEIEVVQAFNEWTEANYITKSILLNRFELKDTAVLVRNSFLMQTLETVFLQNNIPYKIIGGISFFERVEIKDIKSMIEFSLNPNSKLAFIRIADFLLDGVGKKSVEKIMSYCDENFEDYSFAIKRPEKLLEAKVLSKATYDKWLKGVKILDWILECIENKNVASDIQNIIEVSGYDEILKKKSSSRENYEDRRENVLQFIALARDFFERGENDMGEFLESITIDSTDKTDEEMNANSVTIMTMHRSKGLEFDSVYIYGANDDIIPWPTDKSDIDIEEERRVMYVAMTRAKRKLVITFAKKRKVFWVERVSWASTFLNELPDELVNYIRV